MCLVYVQFVCVCTQKKRGGGGGGVFSDFSSHFQSISTQPQLVKRVEKIQEKILAQISSEAGPLRCGQIASIKRFFKPQRLHPFIFSFVSVSDLQVRIRIDSAVMYLDPVAMKLTQRYLQYLETQDHVGRSPTPPPHCSATDPMPCTH